MRKKELIDIDNSVVSVRGVRGGKESIRGINGDKKY